MRVVGWDEFRKMPDGTIFQEVLENSHILGDLMIFGGASEEIEDFVAADLLPEMNWPSVMGEEGMQHLGIREGEPVEVIFSPSGFGRDAMYDCAKRRWLIWEQADRERLAGWLLDPAKAVEDQNSDTPDFVLLPLT